MNRVLPVIFAFKASSKCLSFLWISSCLFFVSLGRGLWNLFVVVTVLAEFSLVAMTVLSGFFWVA